MCALFILLLWHLCVGCCVEMPSLDCREMERGIDVSHWQGTIDWEKVSRTGIRHACIKMSQGETYVDPNFVENWWGAKAAGINVNCYHYFSGSKATPEKQFANLKVNALSVGFNSSENVLVLDVEAASNEGATPQQMADNLYGLLTLIVSDTHLNSVPMIYTSPWYWDNKVDWRAYDFSGFPLWVAQWHVDKPVLPLTWSQAGKTWNWWQFSSKGTVDGIPDSLVDLNWVKPS